VNVFSDLEQVVAYAAKTGKGDGVLTDTMWYHRGIGTSRKAV
jgi:hypothetical protein